jgi:hypothetical protein
MKTRVLERKERIAAVIRNTKAAEARRRAIANGFRARLEELLRERGVTPDVAQDALVSAAVSAYTEIQVISDVFIRARASTKSLTRLGLARGQLGRVLRQLGLAGNAVPDDSGLPGASNGEGKGETLANWVESRLDDGSAN